MIKTPPKYESVKKLLKLHKDHMKDLNEVLEMLKAIKCLADDIKSELNLAKNEITRT